MVYSAADACFAILSSHRQLLDYQLVSFPVFPLPVRITFSQWHRKQFLCEDIGDAKGRMLSGSPEGITGQGQSPIMSTIAVFIDEFLNQPIGLSNAQLQLKVGKGK